MEFYEYATDLRTNKARYAPESAFRFKQVNDVIAEHKAAMARWRTDNTGETTATFTSPDFDVYTFVPSTTLPLNDDGDTIEPPEGWTLMFRAGGSQTRFARLTLSQNSVTTTFPLLSHNGTELQPGSILGGSFYRAHHFGGQFFITSDIRPFIRRGRTVRDITTDHTLEPRDIGTILRVAPGLTNSSKQANTAPVWTLTIPEEAEQWWPLNGELRLAIRPNNILLSNLMRSSPIGFVQPREFSDSDIAGFRRATRDFTSTPFWWDVRRIRVLGLNITVGPQQVVAPHLIRRGPTEFYAYGPIIGV